MQTAFISLMQAAERLGLSRQRMQQLAQSGRLVGAVQVGEGQRRYWIVPAGEDGRPTVLPTAHDGRRKR